MAIDFDAIPNYTPAQMLKLVNQAIVDVMASGQSNAFGSTMFTRADLDKLRNWRRSLMEEVDLETAGSDIAAVRFRDD